MIHVKLAPEPSSFDESVRKPGNRFLTKTPHPSNKEFNKNNYWKRAIRDLEAAYKRICAYSCSYLASQTSIDHFQPKSKFPLLAYEWSNYRLASPRLNQYKADHTNILDPSEIANGWFTLDFPSCLVLPGKEIPSKIKAKVERTISVLKLNDDDSLVQNRCDLMVLYAQGDISINFLLERYPFLAMEIHRQGIQNLVTNIFKPLRKSGE